MKTEKTDAEKLAAYEKIVEGGRRGGLAVKHFTIESKERQKIGATNGGHAGLGKSKNFSPESLKKFSEHGKKMMAIRWHSKVIDSKQ